MGMGWEWGGDGMGWGGWAGRGTHPHTGARAAAAAAAVAARPAREENRTPSGWERTRAGRGRAGSALSPSRARGPGRAGAAPGDARAARSAGSGSRAVRAVAPVGPATARNSCHRHRLPWPTYPVGVPQQQGQPPWVPSIACARWSCR